MSEAHKSSPDFALDDIDSMLSRDNPTKMEKTIVVMPKSSSLATRPKPSSPKKRKVSDSSESSIYEGLGTLDIHSKLHTLLSLGLESIANSHMASLEEAEEEICDLRKTVAEALKKEVQEFAKAKKDLDSLKSQHAREMDAFCLKVKRSAALAVCQARIQMAKQATDEGFDKSSWDIAGWEQKSQELGGKIVKDPAKDKAEGSTAGDMEVCEAKVAIVAKEHVMEVPGNEGNFDKA